MKLNIVGASNFVNRMYEACGPFQWAREFLRNSLEANATRVEFGIEWQAVENLGCYRRTVLDDGTGMSREELLRFFSTLGEGAKKIGGLHDNFGVGAKIASLPWNPAGVVVISYKEGKAAMIQIVLDPGTGDYELVEFHTERGVSCVIDPTEIQWEEGQVKWNDVAPSWVRNHGTAIVLLGGETHKDTILGSGCPEEAGVHGLPIYLNSRFWDLTGLKVSVTEVRSEKKAGWPHSRHEKDENKQPINRRIMGAAHYINYRQTTKGQLSASGRVSLDKNRVAANWYLWDGARPPIHGYAREIGYIAVRYKDELFQLTSNKVHFRSFGIIDSKVQRNLTIVLEPIHLDPGNGGWGVHPDQSRNRLIFTGGSAKGIDLPILDWGQEFAANLPQEILEAIRKARNDVCGSIEDEAYRKRLQDRFGNRWRTPLFVAANNQSSDRTGKVDPASLAPILEFPPNTPKDREKGKGVQLTLRPKAALEGPDQIVERKTPTDVPRYRYCGKEEFEKPWHIAIWAPNDPDGPTVLMNRDAPIIEEAINYHMNQYPLVYAEEVKDVVMQVYGEVAVSKVAHSQKLVRLIAQEELDREYRSEQALTLSLMGLLAEESVIAQRLLKLGRKTLAGKEIPETSAVAST